VKSGAGCRRPRSSIRHARQKPIRPAARHVHCQLRRQRSRQTLVTVWDCLSVTHGGEISIVDLEFSDLPFAAAFARRRALAIGIDTDPELTAKLDGPGPAMNVKFTAATRARQAQADVWRR